MSAIYYSDNLEAVNGFFVASSRITASSTQVKKSGDETSLLLLLVVLTLVILWLALYFVLLIPLSVLIYSVFNLMMLYILNRTKTKLHTYSFEKTNTLYQSTVELKSTMEEQLNEIRQLGWFPLRKPIYWGISSLYTKISRLGKLYETVLFAEMPTLSPEEAAAYTQFLDNNKDIWQDDSDNVYARDTHELLKNRHVRK
jgi:hypothetical protein